MTWWVAHVLPWPRIAVSSFELSYGRIVLIEMEPVKGVLQFR